MYKYTICFIRRKHQLLMLNRSFAPVMGLWHGVGGKIETGETPYESVIREICEETGIALSHVQNRGIVSWDAEGKPGGMYAYIAVVPDNYMYLTPRNTDEGILDWKDISWVLDPNNYGVAAHVSRFLPTMLDDDQPYDHQCVIRDRRLVDYRPVPLAGELISVMQGRFIDAAEM